MEYVIPLVAVLLLLGLLVLVHAVETAPEGQEDAEGFKYRRKSRINVHRKPVAGVKENIPQALPRP